MSKIPNRLVIDLNNRPRGFQKALEKLWDTHKARGILLEASLPDLTVYTTVVRKIWRATQVNPTRVCGALHDMEIIDGKASFRFESYGPLRSAVYHDIVRGADYALACRLVVNASGGVLKIGSIDYCPTDQLGDPQQLVIEKL